MAADKIVSDNRYSEQMEMINVVRQRSVFSSSSEPLPGRWIACPDSFLLGPSDVDPEQHTTKRFAYWQAVGEALGLDWIVRRGRKRD